MPISDEHIEKRMLDLPKEIKDLEQKALLLRVAYLEAKADYRKKYHETMKTYKIANPEATQSDIKAEAEISTTEDLKALILKEQAYKNAKIDADALDRGHWALGGISANRRASGFKQPS